MNDKFDIENEYFCTTSSDRYAKNFSHFEFFKKTNNLPGDLIEFGVFKGNSFFRWVLLRDIFSNSFSRKIYGFDTFDEMPNTNVIEDKEIREIFIAGAGSKSKNKEMIENSLRHRNLLNNIELIKGNIINTLPVFLKKNPASKFSLVNLDVDMKEPTETILKLIFPRLSVGGIIILDDYSKWVGANIAVDEFLSKNKNVQLKKLEYCSSHVFIEKTIDK